MARNFGLARAAAEREQRAKLRAVNPEIPPDLVYGDVGFHPFELEELDHDARAWVLTRFGKLALCIILAFSAAFLALVLVARLTLAHAHDDGRYADSPLKAWFNKLASGKGLCCSFADGRTISDVDWGTHDDHYWVIIDGMRYAVPHEAVINEPNKYGKAVVWPYTDADGHLQIRCFMAGTLS